MNGMIKNALAPALLTLTLTLTLTLGLMACSTQGERMSDNTSQAIDASLQPGARAPAQSEPSARPAQDLAALLPPLRETLPTGSRPTAEPRFDLVVTDAPLQQIFSALVADTGYSMLVRPARGPGSDIMDKRLTVSLRNVDVPEALDALRELVGFDFRVEGQRILVQPPELMNRLFRVNYVVGQRRGVSDIQVVGGASRGGMSSGSGFDSTQASALTSFSKADFWSDLEDTLRNMLGCSIPRSYGGDGRSTTVTSGGGQTSATSSSNRPPQGSASGYRADTSFQGENNLSDRPRGSEGCPEGRSVFLNSLSGTVHVRALPAELREIGQMLQSIQGSVDRQVIIEAKIIDVELNAGAQQGINWSAFFQGNHLFSVGADTSLIGSAAEGGGNIDGNTTLGNLLGRGLFGDKGSAFSAGLGMALQLNNFSALLNFLETQGTVNVLSSPRIATVNNQKAVLKVGNEEPFVTNINPGRTYEDNTQSGSFTSSTIISPTLNYQPFFSGIALDVTPQIDADGNITLHVHTMVNSVSEVSKISTPTSGGTLVPFATNSIKETDSIIRTRDNQVVVIGGLMTESSGDSRAAVPGAGEVPLLGALFRKKGQRNSKREMVILLRPTVVNSDSQWNDDIAGSRERIRQLNGLVERRPLSRP